MAEADHDGFPERESRWSGEHDGTEKRLVVRESRPVSPFSHDSEEDLLGVAAIKSALCEIPINNFWWKRCMWIVRS